VIPATGNRAQLIEAAKGLLHQQGLHRTTLAEVANRARIPLGNVYYYFRTKESLAGAVIESHVEALEHLFRSWDTNHRDPRDRLRALLRTYPGEARQILNFGCPHGSLCQELEKLGARSALAKAGARLLGAYLRFAERQFRALGHGNRASPLARDLVASLQGTLLLAHTMRSRALLKERLLRIEQWVDDLPVPASQKRRRS
jgi:AcrR family transcriptional regulator